MQWHLSEPRPWEAPSLEGADDWLDSAGCIVELCQFRSSFSLQPQGPRALRCGHSS
jgi:hypothetical protein